MFEPVTQNDSHQSDTVRLPDSLFVIINPMVRLLLRSPLHSLWSHNLMLITFTGRKSGRTYTTPVRYLRTENKIQCFTSSQNKWWRNLRGGAEVNLLLRGKRIACYAQAIIDQPATIRNELSQFLNRFPQDSPYYGIRLDRDKSPFPPTWTERPGRQSWSSRLSNEHARAVTQHHIRTR